MAFLIPYPDNVDLNHQTIELPGTRRPGQTGHYRNAIWPDLVTPESPQSFPFPLRTLSDVWKSGFTNSRNQRFLGHRPILSTNPLAFAKEYVWETYAEVEIRWKAIGSAIHHMFESGTLTATEEGYRTVGLWSQNRPEWQIVDIATQNYNQVSVSLYDTLGSEACEFIVQHSSLSIVFATPQHIPALLALASKCPKLKVIVSIGDLPASTKGVLNAWAKDKGIEVVEFTEMERRGREHPVEPIPATIKQVATICYTSGTTNVPKGVVLTHSQFTCAVVSCLHGSNLNSTGILLSYLPLAHIYARCAELTSIALGLGIGYFTGDPLRLLEDAQILKPHYFPSVPRVLNRVYTAAQATMAQPGLKGALLRKATAVKLKNLRETGIQTHAFWDRLVFRKIHALLGGELLIVTTGSAPLGIDAIEFLRIAFGCQVIEGSYGMTENCATVTRVLPVDPTSPGTIGGPHICCEIKLIDVPQMGYTALDKPNPRGEVCVRGSDCFTEYYHDPKNTKETIDEEGWTHTGDVGEIDSCGRFKIIDRMKNIMKLAQGEYVALEKVENAYSTCPIVSQIFIHGESLQDHLLAVVVPDPIQLVDWAHKLGITSHTVNPADQKAIEKLVADKRVKELIQSQMDKEAKKQGLKGFETAKKIFLSAEMFSPDNGLLTPTLKIRRKEAYNKYKEELDALYAAGPKADSKF